jgi:hypothetical protein
MAWQAEPTDRAEANLKKYFVIFVTFVVNCRS